ncbi:MAG: DUF2461 domain-containing protein [Bacteroidia bacterium]
MLQQKTLDFLAGLRENNNREWFEENRKQYEAAKKDVEALVNKVLLGLADIDPAMAGLEAKGALFRIFRDVRFAKDKSPYKTNMGAWMASGGKNTMNAGYYLHVEPGNKSFLAGGSYMPPANVLQSIREAVDYDHEGLREIITAPAFTKWYKQLDGEALRTVPKGYAKDHPAIDLLKFKSFVASHPLTDKDLTSAGLVDKLLDGYRAMYPLNVFLNRAIAEAKPA